MPHTRRSLLLVPIIAIAIAGFFPVPASAVECGSSVARVRFDVNPKTDVSVGDESQFRIRFQWTTACTGGTSFGWTVFDNYNRTEFEVRPREYTLSSMEGDPRSTTIQNYDFNQNYLRSPGRHQFFVRFYLDGSQITESGIVQIDVVDEGAKPAGSGPATTGGEVEPPPPVPIDLAIRIGNVARVEGLAQYIEIVYTYAIGVAVTVASVMVVIGGLQYILARGDPGKIGAAKQRITNAILGLILALGSYVILNTINPQLTRLQPLVISNISSVQVVDDICEDIDRKAFKVSPGTGRCGAEGKVSARGETEPANEECKFSTCSVELEACADRGSIKGLACVDCRTVTDDTLGDWSLEESNEACDRFTPRSRPGSNFYRECIYAQDNEFGQGLLHIDDVCALVVIDCSQVRRCGDYDSAITATHGGVEVDVERMAIDALLITSRENADDAFERLCNADPCSKGPCHAIFDDEPMVGRKSWNCMEGGS